MAAAEVFVANTNSVLFTEAEKVASASAHIAAPFNIASVPPASKGAPKSIRPNTSPSFISVKAVDSLSFPVLVEASAEGPLISKVSSD